eukprot:SAG25_NODE_9389_length_374_cov_0.945455_1_plen_66_part_10
MVSAVVVSPGRAPLGGGRHRRRDRRCRLNLALLCLLLTRRARNASGTATQCTRRNDLSHHRLRDHT